MREIEPYSTPKLTVWALSPLRLPQIKFPRIQIQKLFYKSSWTPQRNHKTLKQLGLKSFQCSLDSHMHCNFLENFISGSNVLRMNLDQHCNLDLPASPDPCLPVGKSPNQIPWIFKPLCRQPLFCQVIVDPSFSKV